MNITWLVALWYNKVTNRCSKNERERSGVDGDKNQKGILSSVNGSTVVYGYTGTCICNGAGR